MTEHFQFAQPEWLYALPFILCLIILRRRRGAEGSITYPTVRFIASLARTPQSLAGKIGALCFVLAAAAIAIALARPQHVEDKTFRTVNGIDIMIAFDLSYSMETPDMVLNRMPINRLVAAKHVITQFVDSRPDDRIGIVGFAGKTKSFCPPNCTTAPSGCSIFTIDSTSSGVKGSKYSLSAISKSVLTVSGLLLMIMVS